MGNTNADIIRLEVATGANFGSTARLNQRGYGQDTRYLYYKNAAGVVRAYPDLTRLAATDGIYGDVLIGSAGITGVTPSGGSSGSAATLHNMLIGIAGTGNANFIQNRTSQQGSSNFNISGAGVIGTTLNVVGVVTVGSEINCAAANFRIYASASPGTLTLETATSDIIVKNGGVEAGRFDVNGLKMASGKGIVFAPDTSVLGKYKLTSFTLTITHCTVSTTGTAYYMILGKMVCLYLPDLTGTDDGAGSGRMSGFPAEINPARATGYMNIPTVRDAGNTAPGALYWNGSDFDFYRLNGGALTAPAASAVKGFFGCWVNYSLQ